jgi:hypothetical protein
MTRGIGPHHGHRGRTGWQLTGSADLLSRWVIPRGTTGPGTGMACDDSYIQDDNRPMVRNLSAESGRPTLAGVLLNAEKDPPL